MYSLITGNPLENKSWVKVKTKFWNEVKKNPLLFVKTWCREMCKTLFGLFTTNFKLLIEPGVYGKGVSFFDHEGSLIKKMYSYITYGTNITTLHIIGLFELIFNILKYFFSLLALIFLAKKQRWFLAAFLLLYIAYFSFVTGFDGCARYRTMFEFLLLFLASTGVYELFTSKRLQ